MSTRPDHPPSIQRGLHVGSATGHRGNGLHVVRLDVTALRARGSTMAASIGVYAFDSSGSHYLASFSPDEARALVHALAAACADLRDDAARAPGEPPESWQRAADLGIAGSGTAPPGRGTGGSR